LVADATNMPLMVRDRSFDAAVTPPSPDAQYRLAWRVRPGAARERLAALAEREDLAHYWPELAGVG
jgi:hypothetical protein